MHAHNPVQWYPWGGEAFAKARKESKLIFLSVGYSSCYWCHVMERESFTSEEVARLLNDWFVCVKVDREERPDIDAAYLTALNVLGQRGGWPLSMFLTADAKPLVGGTYWPPDDRVVEGEIVRGFKSILRLVHDWQREKPAEVEAQAGELAKRTAAAMAGGLRGQALVPLDRTLVDAAVNALKEEFDPVHGGFGRPERNFKGTKFPVPTYLGFLLCEARRTRSAELRGMLTLTLDHMARGGIYDQLGGGFHRYAVERTWAVPHFEKMLYDNAQLAEVYARAYELTREPLYRRVVQETLEFVTRELAAPGGGFYSALDAETAGEEGRYYVWTDRELHEALPEPADLALARQVYAAGGKPNFEGKFYILAPAKPLAELAREMKLGEGELEARLAPVRKKLLAARSMRARPFLDTKVLTGWNGQMIAGLAVSGRVTGEPAYLEAARRAAEFVLTKLRTPDGRLLRSYAALPGRPPEARLNGYLDDYAFLAHGLLCLHDATGEQRWVDEARSLTDTMTRLHGDAESGGFFYTSGDHEKLFVRAKDQFDSAQPSGNSAAAANLVRLWRKTGEEHYRQLAERTFLAFAGVLKVNPTALPSMAHALSEYLEAREPRGPEGPKAQAPPGGGARKSESVVKVKAAADKPDAEGRQRVTLTLTIEGGWHLYANPVPKDFPGIPVTVTVEKARPEDVRVEYPAGKTVKDALLGDYQVYEKEAEIKVNVRRPKEGGAPLEVSVKVQACTEQKCLLPGVIKLTVP
jgi:uncharacterized protein YyaL (SSP411 family)